MLLHGAAEAASQLFMVLWPRDLGSHEDMHIREHGGRGSCSVSWTLHTMEP